MAPESVRPTACNLQPTLLGLFPWFGENNTGGIQVSARLAWTGLSQVIDSEQGHTQLICYQDQSAPENSGRAGADMLVARSKLGAILLILTRQWDTECVLIWHIGLLKLLPFLRLPDARVVLFLHGVEVWQPADWLIRKLLSRVDLFLSNSDHTWHRFLDFHPHLATHPHQTIHLGMGEPTNTLTNHQTNPPSNQLTVLMLSRLARTEDYKGHREMIAAWPLVLERIPNARLWIAGKGDLRPDLEQMIQDLGLEEHIRIWGWISEEKKQQLLAQSRCFALPSRGEGFGLVYLEAMRLGRPCLVSTLDAGREVVNPPEAGLAVDPRDPQAVADAVCRLLTPGPEWDRWSVNARRRYETHFTARHFQERLVSALFGSEF